MHLPPSQSLRPLQKGQREAFGFCNHRFPGDGISSPGPRRKGQDQPPSRARADQEKGCGSWRRVKPWVSLGRKAKLSFWRQKNRREAGQSYMKPLQGGEGAAHPDWSREKPASLGDRTSEANGCRTWSQPPLLFLSLSPLSLSPAFPSTSLPLSLSSTPKLQPSFSNRHNQGGVQGALSQMASQVLSKWRMALKEESRAANSLPWVRHISGRHGPEKTPSLLS